MYSLLQFDVLMKFKKRKSSISKYIIDESFTPTVTIQLPIYNEKYVVERLLDSICRIEYPLQKLQIQILDDSTDETSQFIEQKVSHYKRLGFDIEHIRREDRRGFKAGALAYGMTLVKGDFIAIFDADFLPTTGFLKNNIGYFINSKVGVVQTPWKHLNENHSLLTKLQAFGLDAHFSIEQGGRNNGDHFINFNGTAGIWRKSCIEQSGGWSAETLTEDLDLSYKAQLAGWKFLFNPAVGSPAELPINMAALKTQQYRWTKGAAECARKNLKNLIYSDQSNSTKLHGIFHLLNSFIFIAIAFTAILSVPLMIVKYNNPELNWVFNSGLVFLISFGILGYYYWESIKYNNVKSNRKLLFFSAYFPIFLSFSMGLSVGNAIGVIEGYMGRKTPFVRTPKFNIVNNSDTFLGKSYLKSGFSIITMIEILLTFYFLSAILLAFVLNDFGLLPLHVLLFVGFGGILFISAKHALAR